MHLALQAASRAVRCGWCHADDAPVVPCVRCGATLHGDCRAEAGRCPTLGCPRPAVPAARRPVEVPWGLLLFLQVLTVLWVELMGLGVYLHAFHPRGRPLGRLALVVLVVGLNARAGSGAALWLLAALAGTLGWRRGLRAVVVVAIGLVVGLGVGAALVVLAGTRFKPF